MTFCRPTPWESARSRPAGTPLILPSAGPGYSAHNFDRFLAEVHPERRLFTNDYYAWINRQLRLRASFVISDVAPDPIDPGWAVADSDGWQDFDLRTRRLYLLKRKRTDTTLPCCSYLALHPPGWN